MEGNRIDDKMQVWSELNGKRIVLAGLDNSQRQIYAQNLAHISSQKSVNLLISERFEEVTEKDLVLLFADMKFDRESVTGKEKDLKLLMEQLQVLAMKRPSAVLLVSDCQVYGKQFGPERSLKEEALGYISHTSREEVPLQYMRMAEHLACGLAREEQLHIRVARQSLRTETENLEQVMEAVIQVLLYGVDGEIYNLPPSGTASVSGEEDDRSPLSPIEIVPDIEKINGITSGGR